MHINVDLVTPCQGIGAVSGVTLLGCLPNTLEREMG